MEVVLALLSREGRWFLQRRSASNPVLPGCWEFPGGKVEPGESPEAALARELQEEAGVQLLRARPLQPVEGCVRLLPFQVEALGEPSTELAWGWFTPGEMAHLPTPPANAALVHLLAIQAQACPGGPSERSGRLEPSGPEIP